MDEGSACVHKVIVVKSFADRTYECLDCGQDFSENEMKEHIVGLLSLRAAGML